MTYQSPLSNESRTIRFSSSRIQSSVVGGFGTPISRQPYSSLYSNSLSSIVAPSGSGLFPSISSQGPIFMTFPSKTTHVFNSLKTLAPPPNLCYPFQSFSHIASRVNLNWYVNIKNPQWHLWNLLDVHHVL